jgi:hypothetical protein
MAGKSTCIEPVIERRYGDEPAPRIRIASCARAAEHVCSA